MVVDTGLFIEHIRSKNKHTTALYHIPNNSALYISAVSLYELHVGATSIEKVNIVRNLTEDLQVLLFTKDAAIKAAELYNMLKKQNKLIEFRDIFIAATCIVNNQPLATLNKKHFERIPELKLVQL